MTALTYPNGLGQTTGDSLAVGQPIFLLGGSGTGGTVFYVSSASGSDSYAGTSPDSPFATWTHAVATAVDGSVIVLMDGHTETIASAGATLSLNGVITVAGGSSGGKPTVKIAFTSGAGAQGILVSGARNQFRNIWFQSWDTATAKSHVKVTGANCKFQGCYFESSSVDTAQALEIAASGCELRDTTFVSIATSFAAQPLYAVKLSGSVTLLRMIGVTFDNGAYGFSGPYAYYDNSVAAVQVEIEQLSLLRGAQMRSDSSTMGFISPTTQTGSAKVVV